MKAYINLLHAYEVKYVKACATSAMRDATNAAGNNYLGKKRNRD